MPEHSGEAPDYNKESKPHCGPNHQRPPQLKPGGKARWRRFTRGPGDLAALHARAPFVPNPPLPDELHVLLD